MITIYLLKMCVHSSGYTMKRYTHLVKMMICLVLPIQIICHKKYSDYVLCLNIYFLFPSLPP